MPPANAQLAFRLKAAIDQWTADQREQFETLTTTLHGWALVNHPERMPSEMLKECQFFAAYLVANQDNAACTAKIDEILQLSEDMRAIRLAMIAQQKPAKVKR